MKRVREINGSEPPAKRKKYPSNLQLLYDEVKQISQLLDAELEALLQILPTRESTTEGRDSITGIRNMLKTITTTHEIGRKCAVVLEQDLGTLFPEQIVAQFIPSE